MTVHSTSVSRITKNEEPTLAQFQLNHKLNDIQHKAPFQHFFVKNKQKSIVGILSIKTTGNYYITQEFFIIPQHRNKGYGSALFQWLANYAAENQKSIKWKNSDKHLHLPESIKKNVQKQNGFNYYRPQPIFEQSPLNL